MANSFLDLIRNRDNAEVAEEGNAFGLGVDPTSIPLQPGMTNAELAAESNPVQQMPAPQPKTQNIAAPAVDNQKSVPAQLLDKMNSGEISVPGATNGREPASEDAPVQMGVAQRLEQLLQERRQAYEDAQNRQAKADLIAGLAPHLSNIVSGSIGMNSKAMVKAPDVKVAAPNILGGVEGKYKPELEQLMAQYKALQTSNKPLSEKDKLWAGIMERQLALSERRANDTNYRFGETQDRLWNKQKFDQAEKNEPSDKQVAADTDMANTEAEINSVISQAEKFKDKLGPNVADYEKAKEGRFGGIVRGVDKIDPEYVKFRANVKALKGAYQKVISGLTVSDTERKELETYVPTENQPYETFKANAEAFQNRVNEIRSRTQKNIQEKQGKNFGGKPTQSSAAPYGDEVERNGKMYKWNAAAGKYQLK